MLDAPIPGKRRRGRQKTGWKDSCKRVVESVGLKEEDVLDRTKWKNDILNHTGDPDDGKSTRRRRRKRVPGNKLVTIISGNNMASNPRHDTERHQVNRQK